MSDATRLRSVIVPFVIFTAIWGSTWIVIRGQLGPVPPQWSVTYRFAIAALAMAALARWKGESLRLGPGGLCVAAILGVSQFCINFNSVYLAERHITSGLVAVVFALLLIPNSLLAWAFLGQKPTRRFLGAAVVAVAGIGLLFGHELHAHPAEKGEIALGIALTLVGLLGASTANVYQAGEAARRHPLTALLAWSMAIGAAVDGIVAVIMTGPPVLDPSLAYWAGLLYLALAASALCFSLYFPVVRQIGPGKAAYSSVIVPVIAMSLSTLFEAYRWTPTAAAGAALALGGMLLALTGRRPNLVAAPDAA